MEEEKRGLFDDSKTPSKTVLKSEKQRMFISGDLSNYSIPEALLREKKEIPNFWKGFLFTIICGVIFIFFSLMVAMSIDKSDSKTDNIILTHNFAGSIHNASYELNSTDEIESCWDLEIFVYDSTSEWKKPNYGDFSVDVYCSERWNIEEEINRINQGLYPLKLYEYNFEIGVLDFEAPSVEIDLPFEIDINSNLTFIARYWDQQFTEYVYQETNFIVNETNKNDIFLVQMPDNYGNADRIDLYLEIKNNLTNEVIRFDYIGKQSNCWYYGSKCTFTLPKETEIGVVDLNSEIVIISANESLLEELTLEIYHYGDSDSPDEFMIVFLWIPPLLFTIGVVLIGINKNFSMLGGAVTALLPVLIASSIISAIIFEIYL